MSGGGAPTIVVDGSGMHVAIVASQWHDVVIEAKKGRLVLKVDGEKQVFESANIDTTGHAQIDFKGVDGGVFQIDSIRLWEGLQGPAGE